MSFAIVEPIVAFWSGVAIIPAGVYGIYHGTWMMYATLAVICGLQYTTTHSSHMRKLYQRYAMSGVEDIIYLNEVDRTDSRNVELVIPHGTYGIASKIHATTKLDGYCALFDRNLYRMSPGASWSARMLNLDPRPLTDTTVKQLMSENRNIFALPGGFIEASGVSTGTELVYLGKLPYWIYRCRSSGYALRLTIIYEGSRFYDQPDTGTNLRLCLAQHSIPCIVPIPTGRRPTLFVRTIEVQLEMQLDEVASMVQTQYGADIQSINDKYGVQCKQLRLISTL
jgi:hypothetical protein